ncbi:MAG: glycosyltransferase family 2 protein, partial [Planctomycetaceae bacterium]|nr:glycosyltransferase family 2 protein [Planctomycetaceae bacterium]
MSSANLSIVIPTLGRESVLLDTVRALLELEDRADEILIIDQTSQHQPATESTLQQWHDAGDIRWIKRETPGIPQAMNAGLLAAQGELVLFLDDDIIPAPELVTGHRASHGKQDVDAVVGQVIQPWQQPEEIGHPHELSGLHTDFDFPFHSTISGPVQNVMAGNLSVVREKALSIGGFDEQ